MITTSTTLGLMHPQATGPQDMKNISQHIFDQLVHYLKYASSAYTPVCPRPNGSMLITHFSDPVAGIVEGFVARDASRKELVLAFRGSASFADILLDTQVQLVPLVSPGISVPHGVRVHAGFLTAWNSVSVQVLAILAEQLLLHEDIQTIVTSGHSMGGSLATLAAVSAQQRFPQCRVMSYSYGAPRTGNKAFAEFFNESLGEDVFRVVHTYDGVPTMISQSLGYHHHGIEYWQNSEPATVTNVVKCDAHGEDPNCSLSIPSSGVNDAHLTVGTRLLEHIHLLNLLKYFGIVATTPFCL
ncbi:alpha/beta-hydrolase [Lentinula boryana]|uniref:Alpha/beta-hydrolase n=1 Tax=Lentinula boryana TaxID=40481 RepID=A0ABQ8QNN3_9AGAR|nr:alpha/beta-hydrolase [Lentinula boryana]